jgi:hypothetical protein
MLEFSKAQAEAPLLLDRQALIDDIEEHLASEYPNMVAVVPRGYLWAVINDSIRLALWFRLTDVENIRFFTALRWEVAPGYYREPRIWKILVDFEKPQTERVEALGDDAMEDALQAAIAGADQRHWHDTPEALTG